MEQSILNHLIYINKPCLIIVHMQVNEMPELCQQVRFNDDKEFHVSNVSNHGSMHSSIKLPKSKIEVENISASLDLMMIKNAINSMYNDI